MKTKLFALAIVASLTMASCMKMPMACCDVPATANVGEMVNFNSSCSMDAKSYEWDFGDGNKSTDANPMHSYTKAGTYTVKMMAMSKNGKKMDETTKTIVVK